MCVRVCALRIVYGQDFVLYKYFDCYYVFSIFVCAHPSECYYNCVTGRDEWTPDSEQMFHHLLVVKTARCEKQ